MSYIRSLSNPEKLYIWGEEDDRLAISVGSNDTQYIPASTFHGIMRRWWANQFGNFGDRTKLKYQGAILEQTQDFRWRLSYEVPHDVWKENVNWEDWSNDIVLWDVTLTYLCVHNQHRWRKIYGHRRWH
ncbi:MAG: hypothetical protein O6846_03955 [Thaumarchaeota archaeon]|nr:hypothetical protein [Nitrososphaerota archaeon]